VGRDECIGVVIADDSATAGEDVLFEVSGLFIFTESTEIAGKVAGRGESVRMVGTHDSTAAAKGVLIESTCLLVLSQNVKVVCKIAGRCKGCGVVLT
jgi:hypothetical protein